MVFDLIVLSIPIPIYFKEDSSKRTRMGLLSLFAMGCLYALSALSTASDKKLTKTSINVFSIWRLATVVQHRVATYPTFDPTWYGPVTLIQACLEIDAASICASITVFWPVITAKFDQIFVTNEITITRSHRHFSDLGEGESDDMELHRSHSTEQQKIHSRGGSETTSLFGVSTNEAKNVYSDTYILEQVDPLREDVKGRVETSVTVGPTLNRKPSKSSNLR